MIIIISSSSICTICTICIIDIDIDSNVSTHINISIIIGSARRVRPIFKLRIYTFGIWVKQIIKQRRWVFLVHRLIY